MIGEFISYLRNAPPQYRGVISYPFFELDEKQDVRVFHPLDRDRQSNSEKSKEFFNKTLENLSNPFSLQKDRIIHLAKKLFYPIIEKRIKPISPSSKTEHFYVDRVVYVRTPNQNHISEALNFWSKKKKIRPFLAFGCGIFGLSVSVCLFLSSSPLHGIIVSATLWNPILGFFLFAPIMLLAELSILRSLELCFDTQIDKELSFWRKQHFSVQHYGNLATRIAKIRTQIFNQRKNKNIEQIKWVFACACKANLISHLELDNLVFSFVKENLKDNTEITEVALVEEIHNIAAFFHYRQNTTALDALLEWSKNLSEESNRVERIRRDACLA